MTGWTAARKKNTQAYVAAALPVLRLADWDIDIDWTLLVYKSGESAPEAQITPYSNAKKASIQFSDGFLLLSPQRQRQVIVHELMHCHLFWLTEHAHAGFALLGKRAKALAESTHDLELERATDALADAFAPLMPPFGIDAPESTAPAKKAPRIPRVPVKRT